MPTLKDYLLTTTENLESVLPGQKFRRVVRCCSCKFFDDHYLKCSRPVLIFDEDNTPLWSDEDDFIGLTSATPDGFCAWGEEVV